MGAAAATCMKKMYPPSALLDVCARPAPKRAPRDAVTAGNDTCSDQKGDEAIVTTFFIDD